jgi:hypothetical protein
MLWLLLLPFQLLLAVVLGLIALPVVILLLPVALLIWIPVVLLKLTFRLVAAVLFLPILAVLAVGGVLVAGAAAVALFVPFVLCAVVVTMLWALLRPARRATSF